MGSRIKGLKGTTIFPMNQRSRVAFVVKVMASAPQSQKKSEANMSPVTRMQEDDELYLLRGLKRGMSAGGRSNIHLLLSINSTGCLWFILIPK